MNLHVNPDHLMISNVHPVLFRMVLEEQLVQVIHSIFRRAGYVFWPHGLEDAEYCASHSETNLLAYSIPRVLHTTYLCTRQLYSFVCLRRSGSFLGECSSQRGVQRKASLSRAAFRTHSPSHSLPEEGIFSLCIRHHATPLHATKQ